MEKRVIQGFDLTSEQDDLIEAVLRGEDVKGAAFAGAGKTSVLLAIEKYHVGKKGLYLCFNKSLEKEARGLFTFGNIDIFTSHALALSFLSDKEKSNVLQSISKKLPVSKWVSLSGFKKDNFKQVSDYAIYGCIQSVVDIFYQSASTEISRIHLTDTFYQKLDQLIKDRKLPQGDKEKFILEIIESAKKTAAKVLDGNSSVPKTHDSYLKKWQLTLPTLDYDYIMFDESQDSAPVLLSVVQTQQCQKIFVGDKFQAIYQFRGCVNAMGLLPYKSFPLSQSFRFGQSVADLANKILRHVDKSVSVKGLGDASVIMKGSEYNGNDPLLIISNTNIECYQIILNCFKSNIPARLIGDNKTQAVQNTLSALIEMKDTGSTKIPPFSKYNNLESIIENVKSFEVKRLAEMTQADIEDARSMINAFDWSAKIKPEQAIFTVTTAHLCKGLEANCVMINDDFLSIINAFANGKEIPEVDLYLFYVAITRAKKKLILADSIYLALQNNLNFPVEATKMLPHHIDNLIYKEESDVEAQSLKTEEATTSTNQDQAVTINEVNVTVKQPAVRKKTASNKKTTSKDTEQKEKNPVEFPTGELPLNSDNIKKSAICIEVGERKHDGEIQYWTPTDTNRSLNPNLAILGTMGTGKTQTVKSMLYQLHTQRNKNTGKLPFGVLIFDYKKDYCDNEFVENTDAMILDAVNLPINPLALFNDDRLAPIKTARGVVTTLTKIFKLGQVQQSNLKKCIMLAYERNGIDNGDISTYDNAAPTLNDAIAIYNNQEKVPVDSLTNAFDSIKDFSLFEKDKRKCHNLFETLKGKMVVVNLSGLDMNIQSLIVALLLDLFYLQMHCNKKPKPTKDGHRALTNLLMVDEADNFMREDFESLRKILKEGREFGAGVILSTQGLDHFKTDNNSYGDYMNGWIVHKLESVKSGGISSLFNVDAKKDVANYLKLVRGLEKHHSIYLDGKGALSYQESTAFWKMIKKE